MAKEKPTYVLAYESMMANPGEWHVGEYTATHESGLSVWVANVPILNVSISQPFKQGVPLWWRFKLWRAVTRVKAIQAARLLGVAQ